MLKDISKDFGNIMFLEIPQWVMNPLVSIQIQIHVKLVV